MSVNNFVATHFYGTMGPHEPVLYIDDGDSIIASIVDAAGRNDKGELITNIKNAVIGPFHINKAEPGDTIKIVINDLILSSRFGYTLSTLDLNVINPKYSYLIPKRTRIPCQINQALGSAVFKEIGGDPKNITVPLDPMIGTIGVSPKNNQMISTSTAAEHGGNMDYPGIKKGSILYFPVFVPGALLFIGDGHARQGDGEILGAGIETTLKIKISIHLIKKKKIEWPRGEDKDYIFTIGNARPVDYALQIAITEMLKSLQEDFSLNIYKASFLLGQYAEFDIANFVNPVYSVVCKHGKKNIFVL